jgi:hypothetical protein
MNSEQPFPPDSGYQVVYTVRPPVRGTAITGFVLAIVAFVLLLIPVVPGIGALLGLPSVILGHVALRQFSHDLRPRSGKELAIASLPIGYLAILLTGWAYYTAWAMGVPFN